MSIERIAILLVEDNPGDARLVQEAMVDAGAQRFSLSHVVSMKDCLERLGSSLFDLVLLDLSLPDASGMETVQKARGAAPDMPIVVLTGLDDEAFAVSAVREGAQDYLVKGEFDGKLLLRAIRYAIERHRLLRERTRAEKEIEKLASFPKMNPNPVVEFAADGTLNYFNGAAREMAETLGKFHPLQILPADAAGTIRECVETGRRSAHIEVEFGDRTISWSFFPIAAIGVVHGYAGDITDRKRAEEKLRKAHEELEMRVEQRTAELIEANAALKAEAAERRLIEADLAKARDEALVSAKLKAQFLANMSHEIRTPMNGVVGMTNLLLNTKLTDRQRDYAETIQISGDSLLGIINDILDFSKIEAGKLSIESVEFDVRDTIEGTLELMAERAEAKDLELIASVSADVPAKAKGDPLRIRQVLMNLISNSIKFTERGRIKASVSVQDASEDSLFARLEISDTGIGIPPEDQSRLFEAFSQGDGSAARKYGGTGLGLAICKQLAELLGGEIGVHSDPGVGTQFWITLRLGRVSVPDSEWKAGQKAALRNRRVLIVGEGEAVCAQLRSDLESWGLRSELASNGPEALTILRKTAAAKDGFDAVVFELEMRKMDGLTFAKALRQDPGLRSIRLLILTSIRHRLDTAALDAAEIDDCLVKPIRQSRLIDSLAGLICGLEVRRPVCAGKTRDRVPAARERGAPVRILLAEDNPVNQRVAVAQLGELGYEADAVENGRQVLRALERATYDIIFMDCQMPVMDGYETTRQIRTSTDERFSGLNSPSIHIIAMTAHAMPGDRERCLAAGMNDYVSKPVQDGDLLAAMERWRHEAPSGPPSKDSAPGGEPVAMASRSTFSTPAVAGQESPVNVKQLLRVSMGDPNKMEELLAVYIAEFEDFMNRLDGAIEAEAAAEIEHLAHKCRGASGACGMDAVIPLLGELDKMAREGISRLRARNIYLELWREFGRIREFLSEYRKTLS